MVLLKRGECNFTTKVKNVQEFGGKLAIIADNIVEKSELITMGDDGRGNPIKIPSIFISEEDGEKLKDTIIKSGFGFSLLNIMVTFPLA